jgi:hypothetical protein
VKHLPLDPVVVPDAFNSGIKWLARLQIDADGIAFSLLILKTP